MGSATMTKEEARATIEAELFALKLRKRMALPEKIAFCESAHRRWVFQSETDRLRDILQWAETWQSLWLPDKLASGEQVNVAVTAAAPRRENRPSEVIRPSVGRPRGSSVL
jgi:hypothetical protein